MPHIKSVNFEQKLAFHTAPTLLGMKAANLVSLNRTEFGINENIVQFNEKVMEKELKIKILYECENRVLSFLYNKKLLTNLILEEDRKKFLIKCGYGNAYSVEECLRQLSEKIAKKEPFPHEIGIFLGYPVEDVIGFMENNGENFKFSGYWKVYGDVIKAKCIFENYNRCRKFLCDQLNQGVTIYQALKIAEEKREMDLLASEVMNYPTLKIG